MTRLLRFILATAVLAAASFNFAHAQGAATITFNDPNCGSWGMTQNGSAFTLTCQSLTCTIGAVPASPLPGENVTLTANCGSGQAVYAWSQSPTTAGCPATSSTANTAVLTAPGVNTLNCGYKVAVTDGANGNGSATRTLNWTNASPPTPTTCAITFSAGSASLPSTGGAITMTAGCLSGTSATTQWSWTKDSSPFGAGSTGATATVSDNLVANTLTTSVTTTYVATATNGGSPGTATQGVVRAGTGTGGGGNIDMSGCTALGFSDARGVDVAYPTTQGNLNIDNVFSTATPTGGSFGSNSALVLRFTTPALGVNDSSLPNFQPEPGTNGGRFATIGTKPCLIPAAPTTTPPVVQVIASQTPSFNIQINATGTCPYAQSWNCTGTTWLAPNTTYYITMVNRSTYSSFGGVNTCVPVGTNCDMRFNFNQ